MANGISDKKTLKNIRITMKLWIKNRKEVNNPPLQRSAFQGGGGVHAPALCRLFTRGLRKGAAAIVRREHPGMLPQSRAL